MGDHVPVHFDRHHALRSGLLQQHLREASRAGTDLDDRLARKRPRRARDAPRQVLVEEEVLAERHNNDYLEGRRTHFCVEVESILEFVPEGFALDHDIKDEDEEGKEEDYSDLDTSTVDSGAKEEEKMLRTEDLKWEEEEREKEPTRYEDSAPDEVPPR